MQMLQIVDVSEVPDRRWLLNFLKVECKSIAFIVSGKGVLSFCLASFQN